MPQERLLEDVSSQRRNRGGQGRIKKVVARGTAKVDAPIGRNEYFERGGIHLDGGAEQNDGDGAAAAGRFEHVEAGETPGTPHAVRFEIVVRVRVIEIPSHRRPQGKSSPIL